MTEVIITGAIGIITSVISGTTSWILARRKYNSEVDGTLIENMQKSLEFYQKLSDDNKRRLDNSLQENKEMKKELDALKIQVLKLATTICTDLSCQLRTKDYSTLNITTDEEVQDDQSS